VEGESISLSGATPDPGWHITGWTGTANDASTAASNSLTMPASTHTAGVTYTRDEYTLNVSVAPEEGGSVQVDPDQTTYHYDDVVTLTATAKTGWAFAGWAGDLISVTNPVTFTMDADKVITATFIPSIIATDVPITEVSLERTTSGNELYPGKVISFSAALLPLDLTTPYSYTINGGATLTGTTNPLEFTLTYAAPGAYKVELAVWNCTQMEPVTDTLQVIVQPAQTPPTIILLPLIMRSTAP